jgi:hypothetical protein
MGLMLRAPNGRPTENGNIHGRGLDAEWSF